MLDDSALKRAFLVVDALDECKRGEPGLEQLLQLISETAKNDKIKWLVTSRNETYIRNILDRTKTGGVLSLELNADSVADAVQYYIDHKMLDLVARFERTYTDCENSILEEVRQVEDQVAEEIRRKADGTFLWVALVFRQIHDDPECSADDVLDLVRKIPPDLNGMYDRMMCQILERKSASSEQSKRMLLAMVNTYRPPRLSELASLAGLPKTAVPRDVARLCGLLTIKEKDDIVYFVHQSAKDYLTKDPNTKDPNTKDPNTKDPNTKDPNTKDPNSDLLSKIFPKGHTHGHRTIVLQSLESMGQKLRRNIYGLEYLGFPVAEVQAPHPDPLTSTRYACVYWVDHLCEIGNSDEVRCYEEVIDKFLRNHFLHWLEALSLMRSISNGVFAITKLISLLTVSYYFNELECLRILINTECLIQLPTSLSSSRCTSIHFV